MPARPSWSKTAILKADVVWQRFRTACDTFFTRRHEDLVHRKQLWSTNLERKLALFGTRPGEAGLYRVGPYRRWVGRPVEELPRGPAAGVRIEVDVIQAAIENLAQRDH